MEVDMDKQLELQLRDTLIFRIKKAIDNASDLSTKSDDQYSTIVEHLMKALFILNKGN